MKSKRKRKTKPPLHESTKAFIKAVSASIPDKRKRKVAVDFIKAVDHKKIRNTSGI